MSPRVDTCIREHIPHKHPFPEDSGIPAFHIVEGDDLGIVQEFFEHLVERVHNGMVDQDSHRQEVRGDIDMLGAGNRIFPEIIAGKPVFSLVAPEFCRRKRCCRPGLFALSCREERDVTGNKKSCNDKDDYPQFSLFMLGQST